MVSNKQRRQTSLISNTIICIGVLWIVAAIIILRINEVNNDGTIIFWLSFGALAISVAIALKNKYSHWQLLFVVLIGILTTFVSYVVYAILHLSVV